MTAGKIHHMGYTAEKIIEDMGNDMEHGDVIVAVKFSKDQGKNVDIYLTDNAYISHMLIAAKQLEMIAENGMRLMAREDG